MHDGEFWLARPVLEGCLSGEALDDPDVNLATIAFFNDALDVKAENERRYRKAIEDK